jgi:hypothetical protein
VQRKHFDVADLVFQAVGGALRLCRADERDRAFQSEHQSCRRAAENQIASRNLEHRFSPFWLILPGLSSCGERPRGFYPGACELFRGKHRWLAVTLTQGLGL